MKNETLLNLNIFVLSVIVISFEIISTRISSVIFVQNYAFIIISLSILGLSLGGLFSYYKYNSQAELQKKIFFNYHILTGISIAVFITILILFQVTDVYFFFLLLIIPFFLLGIISSLLFRLASLKSFKAYAASLTGSAIGAFISLIVFTVFTASNYILFLAIATFLVSLLWLDNQKKISPISIGIVALIFIAVFGKQEFFGSVPIGLYPEKDIYYTYDDPSIKSSIIESKWGINGRADLVEYDNQDIIKYLFIDGAAGSQMFKFNGNIAKHDTLLNRLLLVFTTSVPFLVMNENEKDNMLVIGPGGGKEILLGLLSEVKNITGVEVNPQFVEMVKKYKDYNGGLYTDFKNVKIITAEGRHFVKQSKDKWNTILMALPSTEQLQSIDNLASNENFLLTKEAISDYLKALTPNGRLIFTVHDRLELLRLLTITFSAFKESGVENADAVNHIMLLDADYAPTVVIKKNIFTESEVTGIKNKLKDLPEYIPQITFLPYDGNGLTNTIENDFLKKIKLNNLKIDDFIKTAKFDISPIGDDKPYFYKINFGIPDEFRNLFLVVLALGLLIIFIPYKYLKSNKKIKIAKDVLIVPLVIFICTGIGFMILEVSLFQKLILYLGYPTLSLSILLASLLIGMGIGSYYGNRFFPSKPYKRLIFSTALIGFGGLVFFELLQYILSITISFGSMYCLVISFVSIIPFGILLGIPFPTGLQLLNDSKMGKYIPWMYSINGIMGVLGSVTSVILSMTVGYTNTFRIGVAFYFILSLSVYTFTREKNKVNASA